MSRTVLITGSSKGLGRSLAFTYARNNYNVIIHGRDMKGLEDVQREVRGFGVKCEIVAGELRESRTIEKLGGAASASNITVLINNAGMYLKEGILSVNDRKIRDIIETNLLAPMLLIRRILGMRSCKAIININSIAGKEPNFQETVYCASKYGLRGFTSSLQWNENVRIIDIYPGAMKTDMTSGREDFNNFIEPDEVASLIFTISENYNTLKIKEIDIGRKNY